MCLLDTLAQPGTVMNALNVCTSPCQLTETVSMLYKDLTADVRFGKRCPSGCAVALQAV